MKKLDVNFKELIRLKGIPLALVTGVLVTGLSGCGEKAECDIEDEHAHLYVSEDGYMTYFNDEHLDHDEYKRQDVSISLTDDSKKLYEFLEKKDLISLNDNLDVILAEGEGRSDFVEYEYSYKKNRLMPMGKSIVPMKFTGYAWTTDSNHIDLTGKSRSCHYVYQAYNVYKDEHGKFVAVPSEEVDDIKELVGEYDYVRKVCYKVVKTENPQTIDSDERADNTKTNYEMQSMETEEKGSASQLVKKR